MHIKKYDFEYSRRAFMEKTAKGAGSAGILSALWPLMAKSGDSFKAYPEELTNIEAYTKGKIKVGDVISKDNVELVQDLLDPKIFRAKLDLVLKEKAPLTPYNRATFYGGAEAGYTDYPYYEKA